MFAASFEIFLNFVEHHQVWVELVYFILTVVNRLFETHSENIDLRELAGIGLHQQGFQDGFIGGIDAFV